MEATTVGDATLQRTLVGAAPHGANWMRRRTIGSGVTRAMNHRTGEEILLMEATTKRDGRLKRTMVVTTSHGKTQMRRATIGRQQIRRETPHGKTRMRRATIGRQQIWREMEEKEQDNITSTKMNHLKRKWRGWIVAVSARGHSFNTRLKYFNIASKS